MTYPPQENELGQSEIQLRERRVEPRQYPLGRKPNLTNVLYLFLYANELSWRIYMRRLDDGREGLKHKRACEYRTELDVMTLVARVAGLSRLLASRIVRGARDAAADAYP
jgi:hypothetical protein